MRVREYLNLDLIHKEHLIVSLDFKTLVKILSDMKIKCVFGLTFAAFHFLRFPFFFFFFSRVFSPLAAIVHVRYMNSSRNF